MFGATRVMAAGRAGLESLPYFVNAFLEQGITQLAPWAADHSSEQIDILNKNARRNQSWEKIHGLGNSDLGVPIETDSNAAQRLLSRVNPIALQNSNQIADNPARLAAWCRLRLKQHCRDTVELWDKLKYSRGLSDNQQLAVVIPYCAEGPTSGTVGIYLGAALRKHFEEIGRKEELVVWGIELCPPLYEDNSGQLDESGVQHAFRGHVARDELLQGVQTGPRPDEDDDLTLPFDINIALDGGSANIAVQSMEDIWQALDRAAAQATACLINGAGGDDVSESTSRLEQGKRWNSYLVHVVSEKDYNPVSRYLDYRVNLPWIRSVKAWGNASTRDRGKAFLRRTDEMRSRLLEEPNPSVQNDVEQLLKRADELREAQREKRFFGLIRGNKVHEEAIMEYAEDDDHRAYERYLKDDTPPPEIVPRTDPFCVNIALPDELRQQIAKQHRDTDEAFSIADLLGANGTLKVRGQIESILQSVLERSDCAPLDIDAQGNYVAIIAISMINRSGGRNNDGLLPSQEFLQDFMGPEERKMDANFNPMSFDLSDKTALQWLPEGSDHDVTVDHSFLILARCRTEDDFKDVSTYDDLAKYYNEVVSDARSWQESARYYGVKLPDDLLRVWQSRREEDGGSEAEMLRIAQS